MLYTDAPLLQQKHSYRQLFGSLAVENQNFEFTIAANKICCNMISASHDHTNVPAESE